MKELELIDKIDQQLSNNVRASRPAHFEIQQVIDEFRRRAKAVQQGEREAKERKAEKSEN